MTMKRVLLVVALAALLVVLLPLFVSASPLDQPSIPHTLEGRSACTSCHTVGGAGVGAAGGLGMPANHQGRADATCTSCHQVAAAQATPAAPTATAPAKPAAPTATAAAKPAAPTATAAAKPAAPVVSPTAASTALPRTGESPSVVLVILGALAVVAIGWGIKRISLVR